MAEQAIANVCLVQLITEETSAKLISLTTANKMEIEPFTSDGAEEICRVKNRILGTTATEDLVLGHELKMTDTAFDAKNFALMDGGTLTETGDHFSYSGPETGTAVNRTRFTTDVWTEEKDADGETVSYDRFRFRHCKGTPTKFTHEDGKFFSPEYTIKSRAKTGESPISIKSFAALPDADMTAAQVLAYDNTETEGA